MFSALKNKTLLKLDITILVFSIIGFMSGAVSIPYIIELGGGVYEVNLITMIPSTIGLLLMVPFGALSDKFGRKPMLIYPMPLQLASFLIYAFATNPYQLILASILSGLSGHEFMPVLLSMVADVAERKQEALSVFFFMSSIGMFLGPALGSLILLLPNMTIRNLYQILSIVQFFFTIYIIVAIKETKQKANRGEKAFSYRLSFSSLLRQRKFLGLIIALLMYFLYESILLTYLPMVCVGLNFTDAEISSISSFRNLATMLMRFSIPLILLKISSFQLFVLGLLLGGISGIAPIIMNNYIESVVIMFVSGLSYGMVFTLASIFTAEWSSPENRGMANSLVMLTRGVSFIIRMITVPIANTMGFNILFIISGIISFSSILPMVILSREIKQ
ncbi:MAG: MFS transporter [Candidatus Bathyarchaeia archaeon]